MLSSHRERYIVQAQTASCNAGDRLYIQQVAISPGACYAHAIPYTHVHAMVIDCYFVDPCTCNAQDMLQPHVHEVLCALK